MPGMSWNVEDFSAVEIDTWIWLSATGRFYESKESFTPFAPENMTKEERICKKIREMDKRRKDMGYLI